MVYVDTLRLMTLRELIALSILRHCFCCLMYWYATGMRRKMLHFQAVTYFAMATYSDQSTPVLLHVPRVTKRESNKDRCCQVMLRIIFPDHMDGRRAA
jgi:hypothetical protein